MIILPLLVRLGPFEDRKSLTRPPHRVDACLGAPRLRLGQKAERTADLVDDAEVSCTCSQHEDDGTERAFRPAAERATHTAPPVVKPASRLVATRQRVLALIAVDLNGAPVLLLCLQLLVGRL
eukprot:7377470-Prymnesium_polylepis.1